LGDAPNLVGPSMPDISFNYLGQFDVGGPLVRANEPGSSQRTIIGLASDARGPEQSPRHTRSHLLEINCWVQGGALQVYWTYSRDLHHHDTIAALARRYVEALQSLIAHCAAP